MSRTVLDTFLDREIFGLHGNTMTRILAAKRNNWRRNGIDGDWLGAGLYFWQDAPLRAWRWAQRITDQDNAKGNVAEVPAVLLARLKFTNGWIDLIEQGPWIERFRRAAMRLETAGLLPDQGDPLNDGTLEKPERHFRDYAVIELAINSAELSEGLTVDAVRCAFIEGKPVSERSAVFDRAHVQIAVRNPNIIMATQVLDRSMAQL